MMKSENVPMLGTVKNTTPVRLILCVGILIGILSAVAPTPASAANLYVTNNGIFLNHGFIASPNDPTSISNVVLWVKQRGFKYQFENITRVNPDGTLDPSQYAGLATWIKYSRQTDPSQKIIAYLSGTKDNVNAGPECWANIADVCQMFFTKYHVDGVNLDFEPFQLAVTNYIQLFKAVRNKVGPDVFLSLDAPTLSVDTWAPADYKAVSSYFQWMMPMLYDSDSVTYATYDTYIAHALTYSYNHLMPGSQLYPVIPFYAGEDDHDTNVENIAIAAKEIAYLTKYKTINITGLGVYWYYDWNHAADLQWSNFWINIQLPPEPSASY